ncbi:ornithine--oxo-acid transaminase [Ornithinimicrobium cerasi]|uniref:ornithine aminotransferase n=1 Tax=Ornithinimicrobium cerasi TaxID=2248773 RepID=A0A285VMS3_9MICO|nr:ornithine--oxo-acid transaminase [Ornithinimicrobium cerasi]SOC54868.1 ornithine--oxo-acid transaminase [Ornithinimicrobium cerasi]
MTELSTNQDFIDLEDRVAAHNYSSLPVVVEHAEGIWVTDVEGNRYLDALSAHSALNLGHRHPALVAAAKDQLDRSTLTSRAIHSDQLGLFCARLAGLVGKDMILPMNTGAEAVETALKIARKWGYLVKGIAPEQAEIIVMDGNFHGRTTTIISFSDNPEARDHYGPYTPGFVSVPFGDLPAIEAAIGEDTVAVILEPVQGAQGVRIPKEGFLPGLRELCTARNVLMIDDEIQAGLGRVGTTLACRYEGVEADLYTLGKALGGGIVPVSAVAADREVMEVITPGTHGSTFGGNPLAAAVGKAVCDLLATGEYQQNAANLENQFRETLEALIGRGVNEVRVRGLWAGVDIDPTLMTGKQACERLVKNGVLAMALHGSTIRLAPPLTITGEELRIITDALTDIVLCRWAAITYPMASARRV